jgi:hypothetical protein
MGARVLAMGARVNLLFTMSIYRSVEVAAYYYVLSKQRKMMS